MLTVADLFAGIGGFSLGLERTRGFRTVIFVEREPFCQAVLARHWPGVPIHDDIRTFKPAPVDLVCGGFPCKQTSVAGHVHQSRTGLDGADSGLWFAMLHVLDRVRDCWAVVENPPGILKWADAIEGGMADTGRAVARIPVSSAGAGAAHIRKRIIFLAHPDSTRLETARRCLAQSFDGEPGLTATRSARLRSLPRNLRMAPRLPHRVDRIKAIGNSVDPFVSERIGRAILEAA